MSAGNRKLPPLRTDREAERFVAEADLSEYDLSAFRPARFEFEKKSARINMRVPKSLLEAVRKQAQKKGMPYQRYIRELLERAVTENSGR